MRSMRCLVGCVLLCSAAGWVGAGEKHHGPPPPADARFEFLKSLEGQWVGRGEEGPMTFEFRVTAGGHAVEEREMIGTPMEMLTLYHMAGDDLVATHYCVLGNQPRLAARRIEGGLAFDCAGTPGNARSHDDEHVHGWSMRLDGDGTLRYAAELVKAGQVSQAPSMVLTRQSNRAAR